MRARFPFDPSVEIMSYENLCTRMCARACVFVRRRRKSTVRCAHTRRRQSKRCLAPTKPTPPRRGRSLTSPPLAPSWVRRRVFSFIEKAQLYRTPSIHPTRQKASPGALRTQGGTPPKTRTGRTRLRHGHPSSGGAEWCEGRVLTRALGRAKPFQLSYGHAPPAAPHGPAGQCAPPRACLLLPRSTLVQRTAGHSRPRNATLPS